MDDLRRIEGKTIQSFEKDTDGKSSFIIIKFKEGGKVNITSFPQGEGVGQLDLTDSSNDEEKLVGKRIGSIIEEFNGESDFLIFKFKDGSSFKVTAFNTDQLHTAGLDISVYDESKVVAEGDKQIYMDSLYD